MNPSHGTHAAHSASSASHSRASARHGATHGAAASATDAFAALLESLGQDLPTQALDATPGFPLAQAAATDAKPPPLPSPEGTLPLQPSLSPEAVALAPLPALPSWLPASLASHAMDTPPTDAPESATAPAKDNDVVASLLPSTQAPAPRSARTGAPSMKAAPALHGETQVPTSASAPAPQPAAEPERAEKKPANDPHFGPEWNADERSPMHAEAPAPPATPAPPLASPSTVAQVAPAPESPARPAPARELEAISPRTAPAFETPRAAPRTAAPPSEPASRETPTPRFELPAAPSATPGAWIASPPIDTAPFAPHVHEATLVNHPLDRGFAAEVGAQVRVMVEGGVQRAELHLNPQELGPIRIELNLQAQGAEIQLTATHALTREGLSQALPELRELFAQQGLQLGQAQVGAGGAGFQPQPERHPAPHPHAHGHAHASGGHDGAPPPPAARVAARGLLDLYA